MPILCSVLCADSQKVMSDSLAAYFIENMPACRYTDKLAYPTFPFSFLKERGNLILHFMFIAKLGKFVPFNCLQFWCCHIILTNAEKPQPNKEKYPPNFTEVAVCRQIKLFPANLGCARRVYSAFIGESFLFFLHRYLFKVILDKT